MDYKRKYEEALEWAKGIYQNAVGADKEDLEHYFPELAESEDERIRKALIRFHNSTIDIDGIKGEDILAWLEKHGEKPQGKTALETWKDMRLEVYQQATGNRHEPNYSDDTTKMFSLTDIDEIFEKIEEKQGSPVLSNSSNIGKDEQKSTDKFEPKLKIESGKWYVCIRNLLDDYGNRAFCEGDVYLCEKDGFLTPCNSNVPFMLTYCADTYFRKWDISDAKDGDVLASKDKLCVLIFRRLFTSTSFSSYYNTAGNGELGWSNERFIPATKEQRDFLFKKMRESGYEWDAENKQPRRISQRMISAEAKGVLYNKVSWSEEDERNWQGVVDEIQANKNSAPCYDLETYDRYLNWIESIKQRLGGRK